MSESRTATIAVVPPRIVESLDKNMLQKPVRANPDTLRRLYVAAAGRRYKADGRKMREFSEILDVYGELYEWFEKKEAKDKKEEPAVPVEAIDRLRGSVGESVRRAFKVAGLYAA